MKKSLLSMAALAFATFGSMANEYTFDFMGQDDMYGLTRSATTTEAQMSFVTDVSASEEGINFNAKAEGTGKGWALVYGVKLVGGQVNPSTTRNQGLYLSSKMTPEITLTVPNGKITGVKLNMAGTSVNTMDVTFNDAASGVEGKPVSTGQTTYYAFSWSSKEGEETVKITWPVNNYSGKYLNSIEVTYTVDLGGKAACGLSFAEGTAKGAVGVDFTAPELSNPNGLDITWTSSAPDVATVDDEGNVTPVAPGKTVITAATRGNDNFAAGDAKYQLTVVPTGTSLSALLEDAPAAGDAVWVDFPLTVTFAASNRAFVIDAEGKAGCIEDTRNEGSTSLSSTTIYKVGDIIPAGWMATNATEYSDVVWKGLPSDVTETTEVTYPEVTSVNCQADADRVVILKNVTFTTRSASGTTKAYGTTPDGVRYEFQDTYNTPDVAPGTYDVTCVVRYTNRLGTVYAWLAPLAYNEVVLEFPESFEVTANCEGVDVTQGEDQGVYTINVNGEIEEDTFTITLGVPEGWDGFIGLTDADYEGEGEVLKAKKYAVSDDEDDWTPIDAMLQGGLKKGNVLEFPADGEEHFGQLYLYTGDKVYMNLISLEVNVSKKEAPVFEGVPENINTVNPAPGTYQGWTAQDIEVVVKGYVYGNADKGKVTITNPEGTVKEFGTKENGKYNGVIANIGDFISAPGTYKVVVDITGCTLKDSSFGDISMPVFTYDYEVEEAAPTTYIPSGITVTPDPTQDVYELPSVKVDFTGLGATMVNSLGYKATAEVTGPDGFSKTVELGDADYTGKAVIYRTGITGLGEYVVTIDLEGQEYFANGWKDFPAEKIVLVYNVVEKPLPTFPEAITMTANNDDVEITIEDDETSVTISAIGTVKAEEVTLTYGALPEDWTGIYTVSGGMMMNNLRTATGDDDEYLWVSLDEFNEQYEGATITEGLSVTVPADGQRHQYMSYLFAGDKVYIGKGIMLAANIAAAPTTYIPSGITVTPDPTQDVYELPSVKVDFTGLGATMVNSLGYKATAEVTGPDGFSKTVELGDADYTGKAVIYRTGITGLGEYVVTIDLEGQEYFANGWKDFPAEKIVLVYNVVEKPLPTFPEAITMTANNDDVEITIEDDETSVTISAIGTVKAEEVTLTYGALPEDWTGIYTVSGGMMMMKNLRTATGDDDEYLWVSLDEFNEEYAGATITEGLSVTVPADGQRHQYMSYLFAGDKVYVGKGIMLAANISQVVLPEFPSAINVTTESEGVDIETASDESGFSVDVTGKTKDEEVTLTIGVPEGWDGMYIIDMAAALMNLRTATGDEEDWISIDEFKADPMGESAVEGNTIVIPTNNDYYHYNCYLFAGDKVYIGKGIDLTAHIEKDTQVGISLIEAVDPDARYFDMSGVEIKNPANGLYIKVAADGKVSKVIVK